jgi:hypothetical protein
MKKVSIIKNVPKNNMRIPKSVLKAIKEVEAAHFRTIHDTGANSAAMLVWNAFRRRFDLPWLTKEDLAQWNEEKKQYILPENSKLLK